MDRLGNERKSPTAAVVLLSGALALGACTSGVEAKSVPQSVKTSIIPSPEAEITAPTPEKKRYTTHSVIATEYWVGEGATAENDHISNVPSAWSSDAVKDFGGVDDPKGRAFKPKHNTFYFALPAAEFDENGPQEGAYELAPWDSATLREGESLFKGRWVHIQKDGVNVYAQWQDVGPCADEQPECLTDYEYVFGDKKPVNTFNQKAGIDISPDAARALGLGGSGEVTWSFVDSEDVPDGPWKKYPAISNKTNW